MDQNDLNLLYQQIEQNVKLYFVDGEEVTAKILFISESDQDVICDVISSTRVGYYETFPDDATFAFDFAKIARVENL